MAKAKKLPSGSWRARAYSYTDADGKKHYESFTAPTRAEAELKASEFMATKKYQERHNCTVQEALEEYIDLKRAVLSPSTIRGYMQMLHYYEPIAGKRIDTLSNKIMQRFVSDLTESGLSPKSVRNIYGFLVSSVTLQAPSAHFKVTLPAKQKKRPESPSDEAVAALYHAADDKMKVCIMLGMRGVRRGEIAALKYEDIKDGIAHIHADIVKDPEQKWVYKEIPKTSESDRYIRVPDFGSGEGYIVKWKPDTITKRFIDLKKTVGIDIRFHDLRHYFASTAAILGIPDIYTADLGGWQRDGRTMKAVYQNNIKSMTDYYSDKVEKHLLEIVKENA